MLKIAVPFVDLRGKTLVDLLRAYPDRALSLVRAARRSYGMWPNAASFAALPVLDGCSHRWLRKNHNPYLYEIETFADIIRARGVYTLNLHHEWGCTAGLFCMGGTVGMLRVFDCPFPTWGEGVMVALQQGRAGEFYNVTWPGMCGVFTAMAPGRFAVAVNKAPMRRHGLGYLADWVKNRLLAGKQVALPPSHLLRQVLEHAPDYAVARYMLSHMPVAVPAIFVLSGTKPGQGCIIERLEDAAEIIELGYAHQLCAGNHFSSPLAASGKGWHVRDTDSAARARQGMNIYGHELEAEHLDWLQAPIINPHTRVAMVADAANGRLMVQGYEGMTKSTEPFTLSPTLPAVETYAKRWAV